MAQQELSTRTNLLLLAGTLSLIGLALLMVKISNATTRPAGYQTAAERCLKALGYTPPRYDAPVEQRQQWRQENRATYNICHFGELRFQIPDLATAVKESPDQNLWPALQKSGRLPFNQAAVSSRTIDSRITDAQPELQ